MKIKIMIRILTLSILLITATTLQAQSPECSPVGIHGLLKTQGNKIVDKNGNVVSLAGNSLFWSQWGGQFWNADVIRWLKNDWQSKIIRAPMAVDDAGGYLSDSVTNEQLVITVVDACIAEGLYVIIDWHTQDAQNYQSQAIAFFQKMATRYGTYANVIYEIYNEPLNTDDWATVIKPYEVSVINAIRAIDPDNLILAGNRSWDQEQVEAAQNPINDPNLAYTLHFYVGSQGQSLRDEAQSAIDMGLPLFVSEWGLWGAKSDMANWMNFVQKNQLCWCNWAINTKVEYPSALNASASTTGSWSLSDLTSIGASVRGYMMNWPNWTAAAPAPCIAPEAPYAQFSLPGILQAENYDSGCQDSAYFDTDPANQGNSYRTDWVDIEPTTDAGGGYDVGYISTCEWLKYTVNVVNSGMYTMTARVASMNGGGSFHVEMNGQNVSGTVTVPQTNGWQNWTDITVPQQISFADPGARTLKIVFDQGGFNINYFTFQESSITGLVSGNNAHASLRVYPTESNSYFTAEAVQPIKTICVINSTSNEVVTSSCAGQQKAVFGEELSAGMYFVQVFMDDGSVQFAKIIKQ